MTAAINRPPAVDRVLAWPLVQQLIADHGRALVLDGVRAALQLWRDGQISDEEALVHWLRQHLLATLAPSMRPVLNLTGTVLHTNLGRAPLPPEAVAAMNAVALGASNLEFDLVSGQRGDRDDHVEQWICRLTGAEAATVVNNNAAAVLLVLNALANRREVVVSRGELIEIGGSFRLPDIMARAGCKLREVGATNRTHPRDYSEAVGPRTALLLKAHTSNYRIDGFSTALDESQLAAIAREHSVPLAVDLGSGSLIDLQALGLPAEPVVAQVLAQGVDVVTFSGDKLLGGPQAGIIAGRADLIARIRKSPLKRALRCDKMTLAALEAVLRLYADPDTLVQRVPTLRLLTRSAESIQQTCAALLPDLQRWVGDGFAVDVCAVSSQIGSGSLPLDVLPSAALRLRSASGNRRERSRALRQLAERLRRLPQPVIGRIADDSLLLDCRCLEQPQVLLSALESDA
ncbi:L-seryl-tRNA(Sec) selenium transferase [Halopseudomonas pachastrellae]|uniref:L-seryl-tRNA(Sec) selenium transferase n=1 Tax=Halopseudomonas pachastrellae TaxID=254161 RepID=A0A1S8DIN3_9GAMM|nr:L-seryl-tRNA(Sec) selenium transferase [Halopseudomonas pachastrellae]ONM45234.1 L-seryl-tRNA(Sec) selenium transferase [Halopseudomonas pachastrellae]SFM50158.1 L-seryl-tRNA(Sec) selenium transferase [Halopseudomonas pachastrellae]